MKHVTGIAVFLLLSTGACPGNEAALRRVVADKYSGDILKKMRIVLPGAVYLGSRPGSFQTLVAARYRVSGSRAAAVEALLVGRYGMAPLRFACCGWESARPGSPRKAEVFTVGGKRYSVDFTVNMFSDEALVRERSGWGKIPSFTILVMALHL